MSDDYDYYGDTDPNNMPGDDDGGGQDAAPSPAPQPAPTSALDGLPGVPVDGHPGLRAGVFGSGNGLLGIARVSDLVARPGDGAPATLQLAADRAPTISDPVLDWEQNSWRWNDPDALAYDLDRKQRQLEDAKRIIDGTDVATGGQLGLGVAGKIMHGVDIADSLGLAGGTYLLGQYMSRSEIPRIQGEVDAIQARLNELRRGSKT